MTVTRLPLVKLSTPTAIQCIYLLNLSKRAVQLLAWLRIFVSSESKRWLVTTQYEAMRDAFTLRSLIAYQWPLILVASFLDVCLV